MPAIGWQILREIALLGSMYVVYSIGRIGDPQPVALAADAEAEPPPLAGKLQSDTAWRRKVTAMRPLWG
ncbi:MAG TPA: hypothetical protein VFG33_35550 [Kribbella sp.]|nr:hypothetical protein [Kribbella sp.]